jgi:hypothetical protein
MDQQDQLVQLVKLAHREQPVQQDFKEILVQPVQPAKQEQPAPQEQQAKPEQPATQEQ